MYCIFAFVSMNFLKHSIYFYYVRIFIKCLAAVGQVSITIYC